MSTKEVQKTQATGTGTEQRNPQIYRQDIEGEGKDARKESIRQLVQHLEYLPDVIGRKRVFVVVYTYAEDSS